MFRLIFLSVIQSLLLCGGSLLLKIAVQHMDPTQHKESFLVHSILLNGWLFGSGLLMLGSCLLLMYILRHYPFAHAYPLTSLSFVFGILGAIFILHETVSWLNWIGVFLILIGCFFVAR